MNAGELCEGRCVEGCFCPTGQYLRDGKCVEPEFCTGTVDVNVVNVLEWCPTACYGFGVEVFNSKNNKHSR